MRVEPFCGQYLCMCDAGQHLDAVLNLSSIQDVTDR